MMKIPINNKEMVRMRGNWQFTVNVFEDEEINKLKKHFLLRSERKKMNNCPKLRECSKEE